MRRIAITIVGVLSGAMAGGYLLSHNINGGRSEMGEIAARQTDGQVASDAEAAAGTLGRGLTPDFRDKLRRELFGDAVVDTPAEAAAGGGGGPTQGREQRTARLEPGGRSGATGDIPEPPPLTPATAAGSPPATRASAIAALPPAAVTPPLSGSPEATAAAAVASIERPKQRPADLGRPLAAAAATAAAPAQAAAVPAAATPAKPQRGGGEPLVAEAQTLLATLGFGVGAADGRVGKRTTDAVRRYQRASGLLADGRLTPELLTHLRADAALLRQSPPTAPAAPATAAAPGLPSRLLGGVQRLIGHDFNSAEAPEALARYCRDRADEWIYDRGEDRMRLCADISGGRIAYRPLPGDR